MPGLLTVSTTPERHRQPSLPNTPAEESPSKQYLVPLWCGFLLIHLGIRAVVAWRFPILAQEANYWHCSLYPSWGYVEHPPLIAWCLWLVGCPGGGVSPLCLRFGALLAGTFVPVLIYILSRQLFQRRDVALLALTIALAMPGVNAVGIFILPMSLLTVLVLLYLNLLGRAVQSGRLLWWLCCGGTLGLAILCSLCGLLVLLASLLYLIQRPRAGWPRGLGPLIALVVCGLVCSPYLFWLSQHAEVAFAAILRSVRFQESRFVFSRSVEVLMEQVVAVGPLLVIPTIWFFLHNTRRFHSEHDGLLLVKTHALVPLAYFGTLGVFCETHPSWPIVACPVVAVGLAASVCFSAVPWAVRFVGRGLRWQFGLLLGLTFVGLIGLEWVQNVRPQQVGGVLGDKIRLVQHTLFGWSDLAREVEAVRRTCGCEQALVFCDQSDTASMLAWHGLSDRVVNLQPLIPLSPTGPTSQVEFVDYNTIAGRNGVFVTSSHLPVESALPCLFQDMRKLKPVQMKGASQSFRIIRVHHLRSDVVAHWREANSALEELAHVLTSPAYHDRPAIDNRTFVFQLYEDLFGHLPRSDQQVYEVFFGRIPDRDMIAVWLAPHAKLNRCELARLVATGAGVWNRRRREGNQWIESALAQARSRLTGSGR